MHTEVVKMSQSCLRRFRSVLQFTGFGTLVWSLLLLFLVCEVGNSLHHLFIYLLRQGLSCSPAALWLTVWTSDPPNYASWMLASQWHMDASGCTSLGLNSGFVLCMVGKYSINCAASPAATSHAPSYYSHEPSQMQGIQSISFVFAVLFGVAETVVEVVSFKSQTWIHDLDVALLPWTRLQAWWRAERNYYWLNCPVLTGTFVFEMQTWHPQMASKSDVVFSL